MKIAKVLNPITLNAILPWSFPLRHLPVLFRYLLNTYDHSFLTVFITYQLILNTFQPFWFSVMAFPDAPKVTPKSFTFFSIWLGLRKGLKQKSHLSKLQIFSHSCQNCQFSLCFDADKCYCVH